MSAAGDFLSFGQKAQLCSAAMLRANGVMGVAAAVSPCIDAFLGGSKVSDHLNGARQAGAGGQAPAPQELLETLRAVGINAPDNATAADLAALARANDNRLAQAERELAERMAAQNAEYLASFYELQRQTRIYYGVTVGAGIVASLSLAAIGYMALTQKEARR